MNWVCLLIRVSICSCCSSKTEWFIAWFKDCARRASIVLWECMLYSAYSFLTSSFSKTILSNRSRKRLLPKKYRLFIFFSPQTVASSWQQRGFGWDLRTRWTKVSYIGPAPRWWKFKGCRRSESDETVWNVREYRSFFHRVHFSGCVLAIELLWIRC